MDAQADQLVADVGRRLEAGLITGCSSGFGRIPAEAVLARGSERG
jgi:hypothetical protein